MYRVIISVLDHVYAIHLLGTINMDGSGGKRSCNFAVEVHGGGGQYVQVSYKIREMY